MQRYLFLANLFVVLSVSFAPSAAQAFCIFDCDSFYDYDGPCPPARPPLLDEDLGPLINQCVAEACPGGYFQLPGCYNRAVNSCTQQIEGDREKVRQDYMNAQIVCRTVPPPNVHDMCRARNSCGQEIPLNGSCKWYCENCYGIDPTGGLDPDKLIDDLSKALADLQGTLANLQQNMPDFNGFVEMVQEAQEIGSYAAQIMCLKEGATDLDACTSQKMALITSKCGADVQTTLKNLVSLQTIYSDMAKSLNDISNEVKNAVSPPPPTETISCDGMNWDQQSLSEVIANTVCNNLDGITGMADPNAMLKDYLEGFAKNLVGSMSCMQAGVESGAVATICGIYGSNSVQCNKAKDQHDKMVKKDEKLNKKVGIEKDKAYQKGKTWDAVKKLMKSKMLQIKAACAVGQAGNKYIKCFGLPISGYKGAKQVCEDSHFSCNPLLPPGVTRDDMIPRCDSAY